MLLHAQLLPRLTDIVLLSSTALRSWNVDLTVCDLNKELQLFETRHTAQFSSQVKGQSHFIPLSGNVSGSADCIVRHVQHVRVLQRLSLPVARRRAVMVSQWGCRDFMCCYLPVILSLVSHGGLHSVCHRPQRVLSSLSSASTHV